MHCTLLIHYLSKTETICDKHNNNNDDNDVYCVQYISYSNLYNKRFYAIVCHGLTNIGVNPI